MHPTPAALLCSGMCWCACLLAGMMDAAEAGPVQAECSLWQMGGGVSGAGVLARYPAPGPGKVVVERNTVLGKDDGRPPITLVKVVDPEGRTVAVSELTEQAEEKSLVTLPVPAGPAGIWRVSVQGGRNGDRIAFTLPPSKTWGIRGEMALGQMAGAGEGGWLWIPPGTTDLLIEAIGGGKVTLANASGQALPGQPEGKRAVWRWSGLPAAEAVRLEVAPGTKAIAIDGVPGLLCPDAASAADLHGGGSEEGGRFVAGPLQARARRWMMAAVKGDLDPHLVFPASIPADVPKPIASLQLYGAYGPLSGLRAVCAAQVLDPASPDFGSLGGTPDRTLHGPVFSPFDGLGLATAVEADIALNPAHGNKALAKRAALLAFYHLSRLQGDDLIREGDISGNGYPITHAFFVYLGSVAGPFPLLRSNLDPEAAAVWRDGLIAVGDRLADYHGYQTNQMWHVVLAHLAVYRATGEIRFRRWFERQATDLLTRPVGSKSKFGQHPAGYFLEDYGPDGNYDAMSDTCLIEAWHDYRELPDADPAMVKLLHDAIERDLAFTSCHWLPQPDGSVVGPTAMATRKVFSFASQGWPGTRLARDAFPLAAAQWQLTQVPATGLGVAEVMPHFVNDEAWARRALAVLVPLGDAKFPTASRGVPSAWTHEAIRVANLPVVAAGTIPCRAESGLWDLAGQIAWKRGALYGLVFWGVPGSTPPVANCRIGGAPSALWAPSTGTILLSLHNPHFEDGHPVGNNGVAGAEDLTHACVSGHLAGGWWWSGRERAELTWLKPGSSFRIAGTAQAAPAAPVAWEYSYGDGRLELTASVTLAGLEEPFLNLPFLIQAKGAEVTLGAPGSARFSAGSGTVDVAWDGTAAAELTHDLATGTAKMHSSPVRCLRIPLQRDGDTWTRRVTFTVAP